MIHTFIREEMIKERGWHGRNNIAVNTALGVVWRVAADQKLQKQVK